MDNSFQLFFFFDVKTNVSSQETASEIRSKDGLLIMLQRVNPTWSYNCTPGQVGSYLGTCSEV
jgi:hypothetical protein